MADVKTENIENFHEYMGMRTVRRAMGVAFVQGLLGIGAATLAVIGLQHFAAPALLSIATIAVGAALLFEGGAMAARYSTLASRTEKVPFRLRPWASAGFVAGLGGIALGILALLQFAPLILIPIAAIALGVAQVTNSGLNARLNALEFSGFKSEGWDPEGVRGTVTPYAGIGGFMGFGALILGLIALAGINPLVLSLIAILSVAAAHALNGAVVFRMLGALHRRHAE